MLGAGAVTLERHLPALWALGGHPVSVYDPESMAVNRAAGRFAIPYRAISAEQAIAVPGVDAVLIASPNAFHREQCELALAHGRHVLCEKPMALTLADAKAMATAAKQAGRVLQVGFHHRFSSEHRCVKELIEAGAAGDVMAFNGVISEPIDVVPQRLENYRLDPAQGGGFTLIDVGQHRIDQILDLFGPVESVSCEMASVLDGHSLDDSVVLTLRMQSGAIGSLNWHRFSRAFASPMMLFGTRATVGSSAFITGPYQSAPVSIYLDGKPERVIPPHLARFARPDRWWRGFRPGWVDLWPPRTETFEEQLMAFQRAVRGDEPPVAGPEDGFRALEVVQASYLAYREKRTVSVPVDPDNHVDVPTWPRTAA